MAKELTEEERYGNWMTRINSRVDAMQKRWKEWRKYLRYYRLDLSESEMGQVDNNVWINYLFSYTRVIIPSIYFRNPDVSITPRKDTPRDYAQLLETLLNYQLEEIAFESEMRRVCMDALQAGTGVMKYGHAETLKKAGKSVLDGLAQFSGESLYEDTLWEPQRRKPKEVFEPNQLVSGPNPFAIRIPPDRFLIDPLCTGLNDARWVVHCILRTVDEVKKNKNYPRDRKSVV